MADWFARPVLHVSNVEASLGFYVDRLGFTIPWRVEWAGHVHIAELDRQSDHREQRRADHQSEAGQHDVGGAFGEAAPTGEVRLFHVQQREADIRADMHAWTGDLDQAGMDEQFNTRISGYIGWPR